MTEKNSLIPNMYITQYRLRSRLNLSPLAMFSSVISVYTAPLAVEFKLSLIDHFKGYNSDECRWVFL
jgi:hypothetical protein